MRNDRSLHTRLVLVALGALAAACMDGTNSALMNPNQAARLLLVNGDRNVVTVRLNGQAIGSLAAGQDTEMVLAAGTYTLEVRRQTPWASYPKQIAIEEGSRYIAVVIDSTGLVPVILGDTGATAPAGASKLRVAHLSPGAPALDVWRTQPDWGTPSRVQFPFPLRAVSPYLQSTSGDWRVFVSNEGFTDTLAITPPITIPSTGTRTVLVLDAPAGGVMLKVVEP